MNSVDVCITLLVYSVLSLVVSPDEGGSLLPKQCIVLSSFTTMEKVLVKRY